MGETKDAIRKGEGNGRGRGHEADYKPVCEIRKKKKRKQEEGKWSGIGDEGFYRGTERKKRKRRSRQMWAKSFINKLYVAVWTGGSVLTNLHIYVTIYTQERLNMIWGLQEKPSLC